MVKPYRCKNNQLDNLLSVNRGIYFAYIGVIAQSVERRTENPCALVRFQVAPLIFKTGAYARL